MISPLRGMAVALAVLAAACARFEPRPFDAADHRARWAERGSDFPGVAEFARGLAAPAPPTKAFDPADGIALPEAELIALLFNGELRAERARLGVARADARFAGLWDDPEISLSLLRALEYAAMPWIVAADAALTIPLLGSRGLGKDAAEAHLRSEMWRTVAKERETIRAVRVAWIDWSAAKARGELAAAQIEALAKTQEIVQALGAANEIPRTDARLFAIERAALEIEARKSASEAEAESIHLKSLMGLRPDARIELIPSLAIGAEAPADEDPIDRHPTIAAARAEIDEAERELAAARRNAWGLLQAGPSYENEFGTESIGGSASFTLPLWNRNRRAIAAAAATLEAARISHEAAIERLAGELAAARRRLAGLQEEARLLEETVAPLADEQLNEARKLAELGDLQALLLLEALQKTRETKQRIIQARQEASKAAAGLAGLAADGVPTMLQEANEDEMD